MTGEHEMRISYYWSCDQELDTPEKHFEALRKDAQERIFEMIKEGFVEGELSTIVRYGKEVVPEEQEEEGLSYSGWWKYSIQSAPNLEQVLIDRGYEKSGHVYSIRTDNHYHNVRFYGPSTIQIHGVIGDDMGGTRYSTPDISPSPSELGILLDVLTRTTST